jgi:hypothetical protein
MVVEVMHDVRVAGPVHLQGEARVGVTDADDAHCLFATAEEPCGFNQPQFLSHGSLIGGDT